MESRRAEYRLGTGISDDLNYNHSYFYASAGIESRRKSKQFRWTTGSQHGVKLRLFLKPVIISGMQKPTVLYTEVGFSLPYRKRAVTYQTIFISSDTRDAAA